MNAPLTAEKVSHTPGPWSYAQAGCMVHELNGGRCVAIAAKRDDAVEERMNIRLIAAAPSMAALLMDLTDTPGLVGDRIRKVLREAGLK